MSINPEDSKPFDIYSATRYIMTHVSAVARFSKKFRKEDRGLVVQEFLYEDPMILASLLRNNYEKTETGRIREIIKEVTREGTFTIMFGKPRFGKTATACWLIEEIHKSFPNLKIYWFGYSPSIREAYPFVIQTFDIKSVSGVDEDGEFVGAVLIYDEMLLSLLGRDALSSEVKERVTSFPTAGHSGYAVIGLSQSTRIDPLYKDLLTYVWFKPFTINSMFEKTMQFKPYIRYLIPHKKDENLLFNITDNQAFMFNNPLPRRWNNEISKAFAPITEKKYAVEYAVLLINAGIQDRDLRRFLRQRNVNVDLISEDLIKITGENGRINSCPQCSSLSYIRFGYDKDGKRKLRCKDCGKVYLDSTS